MHDGGADVHLRDLRYFVTVAEELDFGRTARRLSVAELGFMAQRNVVDVDEYLVAGMPSRVRDSAMAYRSLPATFAA